MSENEIESDLLFGFQHRFHRTLFVVYVSFNANEEKEISWSFVILFNPIANQSNLFRQKLKLKKCKKNSISTPRIIVVVVVDYIPLNVDSCGNECFQTILNSLSISFLSTS